MNGLQIRKNGENALFSMALKQNRYATEHSGRASGLTQAQLAFKIKSREIAGEKRSKTYGTGT